MALIPSILSLTVRTIFRRYLRCICFDVANAKFAFAQDALRPRCLLIQFTLLHLTLSQGQCCIELRHISFYEQLYQNPLCICKPNCTLAKVSVSLETINKSQRQSLCKDSVCGHEHLQVNRDHRIVICLTISPPLPVTPPSLVLAETDPAFFSKIFQNLRLSSAAISSQHY